MAMMASNLDKIVLKRRIWYKPALVFELLRELPLRRVRNLPALPLAAVDGAQSSR